MKLGELNSFFDYSADCVLSLLPIDGIGILELLILRCAILTNNLLESDYLLGLLLYWPV